MNAFVRFDAPHGWVTARTATHAHNTTRMRAAGIFTTCEHVR
jgi:hypothetical protein